LNRSSRFVREISATYLHSSYVKSFYAFAPLLPAHSTGDVNALRLLRRQSLSNCFLAFVARLYYCLSRYVGNVCWPSLAAWFFKKARPQPYRFDFTSR